MNIVGTFMTYTKTKVHIFIARVNSKVSSYKVKEKPFWKLVKTPLQNGQLNLIGDSEKKKNSVAILGMSALIISPGFMPHHAIFVQ